MSAKSISAAARSVSEEGAPAMDQPRSRRSVVQGTIAGSIATAMGSSARARQDIPVSDAEAARRTALAITKDEVLALMHAFHELVMVQKGTAAEQAAFFLHPEPRIFIPHGEDLTLQANYTIHQQLTDERHVPLEPFDITPLSSEPERVRAVGAVYWQGRVIGAAADAVIKCIVGEKWIVQRLATGELKIALYINPYHRFLPDSAPFSLR